MADTISSPIATADATITGISRILQEFVQQTLTNEQTAESSLGMVDAEIGSLGSIWSAMTNAINNWGNNPIPGQTPPNSQSSIKESPITGGNPDRFSGVDMGPVGGGNRVPPTIDSN